MDVKKIELAFKHSVDSALQQDIVSYLEVLFRKTLKELFYEATTTSYSNEYRESKLGELRILKRIIEVLKKDKVNYDD